ncbi:MAG: YggT family protein [Giesbergeria sp.]
MLHQIVTFLLDVVAGLLCGMCLLRIYMQWQRIPFSNPVGRLVFALTDWLVLPLRRAIVPLGRLDLASLLAALLVEVVQYLLLWVLFGAGAGWQWLPWLALFGVVRVALTGMAGLLIAYAVLSWVQAHSPVSDVIARLSEPLLRPVRRVLPLVGGVDLSPLVVLVLLQVALMVLGHLQFGPLR